MPTHSSKLEGRNKLIAIALAIVLAIVLFAGKYYDDFKRNPPKDISDIRVGEHIVWDETVMQCTFTVYNIQSVVPPAPEDRNLVETSKLCGSLQCKPSSPVAKDAYSDRYVCYDLADIKRRL